MKVFYFLQDAPEFRLDKKIKIIISNFVLCIFSMFFSLPEVLWLSDDIPAFNKNHRIQGTLLIIWVVVVVQDDGSFLPEISGNPGYHFKS
jgi:hypothetical protein